MGSFLQQPGATTFDTKFDLTQDPGGLLGGALHLWNPTTSLGSLQNQIYGYFFPQGTWYLVMDWLAIPDWVSQRLWSALVLIVAYEGCRLLVRSLGMPTFAGVLTGLVYVFSARFLGSSGVLTGEILPSSLLPWSLLPLVLAVRGRLDVRAAGLLSGVAVLCMSGVNAVGTLAMLPAGLCIVLTQFRRSGGRRLAFWWGLGVALAVAWWVVPLLMLGKYSPPFLDFIETASTTTNSTGWSSSVRGADHWVAYAEAGGQAWWPGAHLLVTQPIFILLGALIAALGIGGLTHRRMPMRGTFVAVFLIGLLCLIAGSAAAGGSLVDGAVRTLLDGPLAPLRNVHKVDPLVRLALALGFGHGSVIAAAWIRGRWSGTNARRGAQAMAFVLAAGVLVSGGPLFSGDLRTPGWTEVPQAWTQAARYFEKEDDPRVLVVPGSGFGLQTWGWTIDEPLQGVARTKWVTRSQVPMVPGPTARILDALEQKLSAGHGSDEVVAMLRRMGITHVLLRRDLDLAASDAVRPERVEATLSMSPGVRRVASYGSTGSFDQALIDIYRVDGANAAPELVDYEDATHLNGAPEDVLAAMEAGILGEESVLVGPGGEGLISDGYRKVERQFGRILDGVGQTLARDEQPRSGRVRNDYPGVPGVALVTAEYVGDVEVRATSAQGYIDVLGAVRPDEGPAAAFDGRRHTAWRSAWLNRPVGQRLEFHLDEPVGTGAVVVHFEVDGGGVNEVTQVRVGMDGAEKLMTVPRNGVLAIPVLTPIQSITIEVAKVAAGDPEIGRVGILEVEIPGVTPGRTFVIPQQVAPGSDVLMHAQGPKRPCFRIAEGLICDRNLVRNPEDHGTLDRTFTTATAEEWRLSGTVVATAGPGAAALLQPLGPETVTAVASSVYGGDPSVSGVFAVDGREDTYWMAEPDAATVEFILSWEGRHTLDRLQITPPPGAVMPRTATITSSSGRRTVDLSGVGSFEPLVATDGATILLERGEASSEEDRPMGAKELALDGLDVVRHRPDPAWPTGAACGLGPVVWVDGALHKTRVSGTVRDLLDGRSMRWESCGDDPIPLPGGKHRVRVDPTLQFTPVTLGWKNLTDASEAQLGAATVEARAMRITSWGDVARSVLVGSGETAILRIPENDNPGWGATLNGRELTKILVDGWQQGYIVPEGESGTIQLTFAPDRTYRAGLLMGLMLALLLLVVAAVASARRRQPELTPAIEAGHRPRSLALIGWGVGGMLLLAGGPVSLVGWAAGRWARSARLIRVAGVMAIVLSGVAVVAQGKSGNPDPGLMPNAFAAIGVGSLIGSVFRTGRRFCLAGPRRWRWPSWGGVTWTALFLVGAQFAVRTIVSKGSYFRHDDFLHLSLIQDLGLSRDYLVRDHGGHVEIGQYLLIWILGRDATTSFAVAAASMVVMQLIASLLLWWFLRLAFRSSWWLLLPFAAYLFTPLGLVATTWWAAGIQAYPLQICMLLTLIGWIHLRRGGDRRWAWGLISVVAHGVGLFFWEKAALILPTLIAVDFLILSAGVGLRHRWQEVMRLRPWWVTHLVLLTCYVGLYLAITGGNSGDAPESEATRGLWSTIDQTVFRTLIPGFLGAPWSTDGSASTIYPETPLWIAIPAVVLVVALIGLSLWLRGRASLGGWVLLAGYVAADVGLLYLGRGDFLFLVVRDPRYVTDALPVIVIGLCAAFAVPRDTPDRARRLPRFIWGRELAVVATVGVCVSTLATTYLLTPEVQHIESRAYVKNLVVQAAQHPHASLVALTIPNEVTVSTDLAGVLKAVGHGRGVAQAATEMLVVDESGNLSPIALLDHEQLAPRPPGDCGWAVAAQATTIANLRAPDLVRLAYFEYLTGIDVVVNVSFNSHTQAVAIPPGVGRMWFVLPYGAGELKVWTSEQDRGLCVTQAIVGTPWQADDLP